MIIADALSFESIFLFLNNSLFSSRFITKWGVIYLIHQLATAHLVRDQREHGAPGFRVRHEDNIVPVHLPRHRSYLRLELKVPETRKKRKCFLHVSKRI